MEEIRLNKFLSEAGICSRREADRLIESGKVTVDGVRAVTGMKLDRFDSIVCDKTVIKGGEDLEAVKPVLLLVHKPKGVVCTTSDRDRAPNIVEFLQYPLRIYPVGRLDKDSEGLLLMTNQGDLVNKIMRSGNSHEKEYQVETDKEVTKEFVAAMSLGVPILQTVTRPCQVTKTGKYSFTIILTQGLNRQIRRMCEYLGYRVVRLTRTRIMNLTLGDLKTGEFREITEQEYVELTGLLRDSSSLSYKESKDAGKNR